MNGPKSRHLEESEPWPSSSDLKVREEVLLFEIEGPASPQ